MYDRAHEYCTKLATKTQELAKPVLNELKRRIQSSQPVARLIISIPVGGLIFFVLHTFFSLFVTTDISPVVTLIVTFGIVFMGQLYTGILSDPTQNPATEQAQGSADRQQKEDYDTSVYEYSDDVFDDEE